MRMQLTATFASVLALAGYTHAATCSNLIGCLLNDGYISRTDAQYYARQQYCGGDRWKNTGCASYSQGAAPFGPVKITMSKVGANSQQVCWDALDNIIQRTCFGLSVGAAQN